MFGSAMGEVLGIHSALVCMPPIHAHTKYNGTTQQRKYNKMKMRI